MTHPTPLLPAASFVSLLACLAVACEPEPREPSLDDLEVEGPADEAAPALEPGARGLMAAPAPRGAAGDCCEPDGAPGCSDPAVEACVCALDSYCCATAWDGICVTEVESFGCGSCAVPHCCEVETAPGCALPSVESCVCAVDSYCCATAWDGICVGEVESLGCGSCASGWAVGIGGAGAEAVEASAAVATDDDGNVYVLGTFYSATIDLGGGPQVRQGYSDVFLVSYAPGGAYRWSRRLGGDDWDYAGGIGVDGVGNVYVAGASEGSLELGGGWLPPSAGTRDLFVASYTSTGAHRWSQRHGAAGTMLHPRDLAVEPSGRLVVVGSLDGAVSLGGPLLTDAGQIDMFVLALDGLGAHRWSRAMGGPSNDGAEGVAVDTAGGAVIAGSFAGSVNFGLGLVASAGSADGVTIRLGTDGFTKWVRRYGSTSIDTAQDVALDAQGNAYMLGAFAGTVNLGDGARVAAGSSEGLVASYGPTGQLRWSRRIGGAGLDYARGIALDVGGHVVATGSFFGGTADLGGPALTGAGGYDVFLGSYDAGNGTHRWSTRFGTAVTEEGFDLAVAPSGAVAVVGQFGATLPVAGETLATAGETDVFLANLHP